MRRVVGGLGKIDVLVNNAGLELITPILEPGDEVERRFERIIGINVIGTYYVTREAVKSMAAAAASSLTASIWGKTGAAEFSAYCLFQARQHRLHARAGEGAGSARHHRQRRSARAG